MTRSWSAGRRREWSRTEKTAWSRYQRIAETGGGGCAHLGLDDHVQRGSRGLGADGGWAERAGEVEEGVGRRHDGGRCAGRCRGESEAVGVVKGVGGGGAEMILFLPGAAISLARTLIFIFWRSAMMQSSRPHNKHRINRPV